MDISWAWFMIGAAEGYILFGIMSLAFEKESTRTFLRKKHSQSESEHCIIELDDTGIVTHTLCTVITRRWTSVTAIKECNDYIRFVGPDDGVSQVPKRVFRSDNDIKIFLAEADRLWQIHRSDPTPEFPEESGLIIDSISTKSNFNPA